MQDLKITLLQKEIIPMTKRNTTHFKRNRLSEVDNFES